MPHLAEPITAKVQGDVPAFTAMKRGFVGHCPACDRGRLFGRFLQREPFRTQAELEAHVAELQLQMKSAAANLEFEKAARLRDRIKQLRTRELGLAGSRN